MAVREDIQSIWVLFSLASKEFDISSEERDGGHPSRGWNNTSTDVERKAEAEY
jgi:hypothetical protein